MANNKSKQDDVINEKDNERLQELFKDLYKKLSIGTYDTDKDSNLDQIKNLADKVNRVMNYDLDEMKKFGGENDISRFLLNTIQNSGDSTLKSLSGNLTEDSLEKLFMSKDGAIFSTFEERFKNKQLLFQDLEIITEQLAELNEAINTTRDDIVAADDLGSEIARSLSFSLDGDDSKEYDELIEDVKRLEREYKLNYLIREHIIPKTLKYGEYFVYIIPEQNLYENAQKRKLEMTNGASMESSVAEYLLESLNLDKSNPEYKNLKAEDIMEYVSENVRVNNTNVPLPLLENKSMMGAMKDLQDFNNIGNLLKNLKKKDNKKQKGAKDKYSTLGFSDGVKSMKVDDWSGIKGCYIKMLDPKKIIPVKLLNYTIGYYYMHDAELDITNHQHMCSHGRRFTNVLGSVTDNTEKQQNIVANIADAIIRSFNKKYLEDNKEFKDLIINSLLYNDMYKRKLHYQFIPADHICRFSINEDENGNGQSMLFKSLFYAKLYLALLVFNMVTYLTKSQDTIVTYVKTSGIDKNFANKTMDIAKQWKSKQIGIGDLMDYSSIYSKIGTGRDLFIPEGESGERGLSWDVIQGQDVDMQSDLMEQLKQAYINGTGVPSVIMNYINEADFAKTLVMANAKQLRRVMLYQDNFNEQLTEMYQKLMVYCTEFEMEDVANFTYTLMRPKTLPNNNLVDIIGYGDQILDFVTKVEFGEYGEETEDLNFIKDEFKKLFSRRVLPMLPWETVDELVTEIKLNNVVKKIEKKQENPEMETDDTSSSSSSDDSGSDDFNF